MVKLLLAIESCDWRRLLVLLRKAKMQGRVRYRRGPYGLFIYLGR